MLATNPGIPRHRPATAATDDSGERRTARAASPSTTPVTHRRGDVTWSVVSQPLPGSRLLQGSGVGEADSADGQSLHHTRHRQLELLTHLYENELQVIELLFLGRKFNRYYQ